MPRSDLGALTRRESQIMDILYRRKRASVEEIRGELPNPPSPSGVRKLLEILMERGHVARKYDGPRFVYSPARQARAASRSALRQLVRTFFDDSPAATFAALLDISDVELSDEEYERLASLLEPTRTNDGGIAE
jgi:predicted transcriptional regulator